MQKSLPVTFLLSIAVLLSLSSSAQLGIIKNPDGFCNVRADASNQSKIEAPRYKRTSVPSFL